MITPDNLSVIIPCFKWTPILSETLDAVEAAARRAALPSVRLQVNAGRESQRHAQEIERHLAGRSLFTVGSWSTEERLPMYRNWNACVDLTHGEYVHIMHDDDIMEERFYDEIFRLSRQYPNAAIYATGTKIFGQRDGIKRMSSSEGPVLEACDRLAHANVFTCPEIIFARKNFSGFDESLVYTGDWRAWFKISMFGTVVFTPEILMNYRAHAASSTNQLSELGLNVEECWWTEKQNCCDLGRLRNRTVAATGGFAVTAAIAMMKLAARTGQWRILVGQLRALAKIRRLSDFSRLIIKGLSRRIIKMRLPSLKH